MENSPSRPSESPAKPWTRGNPSPSNENARTTSLFPERRASSISLNSPSVLTRMSRAYLLTLLAAASASEGAPSPLK